MEGAGEIAALAIPFAAGAAAGCGLVSATAGTALAGWMPAALGAGIVALLPAALSGRRPLPCFGALFFLLGCFCQCSCALLPPVPVPLPSPAGSACTALKRLIASVPYPHPRTAGIIQALLTGDRSGLSRETTAAFRASGAAHLLALSGLHLGLIYLIVRRLFSLFGNTPAARRGRCAATLATTAFYTLMTGAGPSTVRAFLYICISEWSALSAGRRKDPARILLIALTLQLALNPAVIAGVGFQLSYLAMLGIAVLLPRLQAWYPAPRSRLGRIDPMRRIWNAAALTLSCQAFTAPLAWLRFHTFPKYFLLTNLLALPLSSAVMAVSVATLTLSALGACPPVLVRINDALIQVLLNALEIISTM